MKHTSICRWIAAGLLLMALATAQPASAATHTWIGGNGSWQNELQWSPPLVPGDGDTAVISGTDKVTISLNGNVFIDTLTFVNPNATLQIAGSDTVGEARLTIAQGFENRGTIELRDSEFNSQPAILTVTSGTFTNAVGGTIRSIKRSSGPRIIIAGVDNRGTLQADGELLLSGDFANNGTVNIPQGSTVTAQVATTWTHRNGAIIGSGTLSLAPSSSLVLEDDFTVGGFVIDAPNLTVNGPGKLLGPPTGEFLIRNWTINAGVIVTGDLRIEGQVAFNSDLAVAAGKTLRVAGNDAVGEARLTIANGFESRGSIELIDSEFNSQSAILTVTSGTFTNAVGGTIRSIKRSSGPRIIIAGVDNRGTLQADGELLLSGDFANNGTVNIPQGSTVTAQVATTWTHRNGAIIGSGTLSLAPSSSLVLEDDFTVGGFVIDAPNLTVNGPGKLLGPPTGEFLIRNWTINAGVIVTGDLRIEGQVAFNSDLAVAAGKTLRVAGNDAVGEARLTIANGFESRGSIELIDSEFNSQSAILTVTSGTFTNAVGGTIRSIKRSSGPRIIIAGVDNRGTLQADGELLLSGDFANNGTVNIPQGSTVTAQVATTWTHRNGAIIGSGTLSLAPSSSLVLEDDFTVGGFVIDAPNLTVNGPGKLLGPPTGEFLIRNWTINAGVIVTGDLRIEGQVAFNSDLAVAAGKTLRVAGNDAVGEARLTIANGFESRGSIELIDSEFNGHPAILIVTSGTFTNAVGGTVRSIKRSSGPRIIIAGVDNRGTLLASADSTLDLNGSLLNASSGVLAGSGTFNLANSTVVNNGTVAPGTSPGILSVDGNFPNSTVSRLDIEIGGFAAGTEYDRLAVSGLLDLSGTIRAGLINAFFPKKGDAFTVLTYDSHTGTFATIDNPSPERIAWKVDYGPKSAQLVVLNSAPTLAGISSQAVNEQTQFSVTAQATDRDQPEQTITYSLAGSPAGMTINPSSGQITWTPTETQGPGVFDVTVRATDNGSPALSHAIRFAITVNEVNQSPQLVLPSAQTIVEEAQAVLIVDATDTDLPPNTLTYEMLSGPPGATFNTTTREFRWTPTEAQGPGSYNASFRVTDNNPTAMNEKKLSVEKAISFTVTEVNQAPVLATVSDLNIHAGMAFSLPLTATDSDLPANTVTYSLVSAPEGATITREGVVRWTAPTSASDTTVGFTVQAVDNGEPRASADRNFQVVVSGALQILSGIRTEGSLNLTWRALPGRSYRLSRSSALPANGWTVVEGDVLATGATATKSVTLETSPGGAFYRVELIGE
jgi:cytoskeletal protein CcmA (bactofilin family)